MTEPFGRLRRFLRELKRRKVYRVAAVYAAVAFVIVQAANLVFPALEIPSWAYSLVVVLALLGFPLALVLAWAFEVTPEGVRRTPDAEPVDEEPTEAEPSLLTGYKVLVGLGLVAATVAGGWYLTGGEADTEARVGERSIAVLPFENMGGEESAQFTQGVHDGLLTRLANISDLKVISRTSVMQFQDTDLPLPAIADSLGVKWVMEGGVQKTGDQIQVNAQLIDPRTDTHAWAEQYRRDLTAEGVFAVQTEITKKIARSLEARLTPEETERVERRPTGNLDAYQLYVEGRRELVRGPRGNMQKALRLFRRAIQRDSTFAPAWAGLADVRSLLVYYPSGGAETVQPQSIEAGPEQALDAARRALQLAPDLAEAHASLGLIHFQERNGPAALQSLQRAVELKPSYGTAHNWLGWTYLVLGRPEQALEHLQLAEQLDPQYVTARNGLQDVFLATDQPEKALIEIREQRRRYPDLVWAYLDEVLALYHVGQLERARAIAREHLATVDTARITRGWRNAFLVGIETALGDTARAHNRIAKLRENDAPPVVFAVAHAAFGDTAAVLDALGEVEDWGYVPTYVARYLRFPEGMNRVRRTQGFKELLREINMAWSLNPDGSLPDSVDVSFGSESDE